MSTDKTAIWAELLRVVTWWSSEATQDDLAHKAVLHAAALAYADAVRASGRDVKPTPTRVSDDSGPVFKFGRAKDRPLRGANVADLEWYAGALRRSIDDPTKSRWRESNEAELAQVETELGQ